MRDWRRLTPDERKAERDKVPGEFARKQRMNDNLAATLDLLKDDQFAQAKAWKVAWGCYLINTPATIQIGDGVTVHLWTDSHAATVIKKTAMTVTVRQDKATLDPNFKPEWIPGGFAAHCINQEDQTYTYEEDPDGKIYTFRWSRKYGSYGTPGNLQLTKGRREFYDYNF